MLQSADTVRFRHGPGILGVGTDCLGQLTIQHLRESLARISNRGSSQDVRYWSLDCRHCALHPSGQRSNSNSLPEDWSRPRAAEAQSRVH